MYMVISKAGPTLSVWCDCNIRNSCQVPKIASFVIFGFSNFFLSLFSEGCNFRWSCFFQVAKTYLIYHKGQSTLIYREKQGTKLGKKNLCCIKRSSNFIAFAWERWSKQLPVSGHFESAYYICCFCCFSTI